MYVGSELTCMDFLPTKQMLFRHVVASSLLLGTVHRRHKAWPILSSMSTTDDAQMVVVADLSSREVVAGCDKGEGLLVRFSSGLLALLGAGVGSGEVPRACG